ncbi:MAG: hypothetical protein K2Q20_04300 [Phycisphaerales bacterium]|nr:hypothetical protein [Phycisphaerales bacterium]
MRWQQQLGIALAAVVCSAGAALAQLQSVGNASFESPLTYDVPPANGNWNGFFGGPPTAVLAAIVDSSQAFTGAQSLRLAASAAGGAFCGMQQPIGGVVAGTTYKLRYRAKGGAALLNPVEARVEWLNIAGGFLPDPNGQFANNVNIVSQLNNTWQEFTWTGTAPFEAANARIVFAVQTFGFADPLNPGFNVEVFIDDVSFAIDGVAPTLGKCCAPGGGCQVTTSAGCTAPATWTINGTCSPNTCPGAAGACCNPSGTGCVFLDPSVCTTLGATFAGSGIVCGPTTCTAGPAPCRADFDNNGTRNVADIFAFLSAWFAGCP